MPVPESFRIPALLVFGGHGNLLFANPSAHALLGTMFLETEDLQAWCIRRFLGGRDYDRVATSLRRALSGEGIPANESIRAQFIARDGRDMEGIFHIVSWHERDGDARVMLSCTPLEPESSSLAPSRQSLPMDTMADLTERIRELLDVAVTVGRVCFDDGLERNAQDLLERLERAQGALRGQGQKAS